MDARKQQLASRDNNSSTGLASFQQVLEFGDGSSTKLFLLVGVLLAVAAGALGPLMIWYFAQTFEELSANPASEEYLENVEKLAFAFLVLG